MLTAFYLLIFYVGGVLSSNVAPLQGLSTKDTKTFIPSNPVHSLNTRSRIDEFCTREHKIRIVLLLQRIAQWSNLSLRATRQYARIPPNTIFFRLFRDDNNMFRADVHEHFRSLLREAQSSPQRPGGRPIRGGGRVRIRCDEAGELCDEDEVTFVDRAGSSVMLVRASFLKCPVVLPADRTILVRQLLDLANVA